MYGKYGNTISSPSRDMFLIVPSNTDPLDELPKAIRANEAGTITLRAVDSIADITINVLAGEIIPVRAAYIRATGTTVLNIHGLA